MFLINQLNSGIVFGFHLVHNFFLPFFLYQSFFRHQSFFQYLAFFRHLLLCFGTFCFLPTPIFLGAVSWLMLRAPLLCPERLQGLHCIFRIPRTRSFHGGMHGQLRQSDIHRGHGHMRCRNISKGRAAGYIGAVGVGLTGHACSLTIKFHFGG